MSLFRRYSISFGIAGLFLYFFTIWVEKKNQGKIPHNLSTKKNEKVSISLLQKRYHEKCVDLGKNNELEYGFNSDAKLSFNLHYHDEDGKIFIVNENLINNLENIFKPKERAYYCLMWINSAKKEVRINYFFKILNLK